MAVLPSLELSLQFHPPQGPWHGGSATCGLELEARAASCPTGSSISLHCLLHLVLLSNHDLLRETPELYFLIL